MVNRSISPTFEAARTMAVRRRSQGPRPAAPRRRRSRAESPATLLFFLAPALAFVLIFIAFPILFSGFLSLTKYNYATDRAPTFIGLAGYGRTIVSDGFFHTALFNQLEFALSYVVITFVVSLAIAIMINELRRGVHLLQALFYMPMIIPLSLVGITFAWILDPNFGIFNALLHALGLQSRPFDWYGDPGTAIYAIVVAQSWKMIGFALIIFIAGLQGISSELREAARVDGATFFQEIGHVVLPLLKPYLLIGSIWILIDSLKVFDIPRVVTKGGPGVSTLTLYLYSWMLAFQRLEMGRASQVAYLTAAIILLVSWGLNRLFKPETAQRA